ncbi:putative MFS family arabinose efflux permease [Kribbella orskensis]|uniref:MFS family arabinose efflux permease n=1 Tax=Kribbella orskensis TaxID=2512216 RepID=A0ABY2BC10_9ACTN|nr:MULTISPECIES: MFS transporter [Kribbella]TCN34837.1 putative MFS family arabinose efflux permease [Kribbella sp. VKM Ac-2500]TCO15542.1 putative MFS family arabinose efflux permease [Kribbella orskensis]
MSERLPTGYYLAATLARVGDEMVAFTLVLLVLERTDSPALAGLTGAAYALPAVVTGPLLGTWLDRTPYRRTALGLNQAVLGTVMLAMLAVVGHTAHWVTPALAALAGTTLPLVSGGFTSMLPSLVPQPLLARANSLEAASFGAATITGPAAAATIAAAVSVEAAAAVIAVTATLSIFAIMRLPALPAAIDVADRAPFLGSVVAGLAHLARTPRLRASTVTTTLLMGVMGVLLITLPLHMESLGAPRSAAGYLWTALEIGSVATALLLGRWQTRWRPEHVVMVSVALYGLAFTTWPLASSLAVLLVLAAATGLLEGPMLPAMFSARQQYSPVELQGRVSTTAASLRVGAAALGQAAGGLLVPVIGTHAALLAVGAALLAASALGYLSTLSRAVTPARL